MRQKKNLILSQKARASRFGVKNRGRRGRKRKKKKKKKKKKSKKVWIFGFLYGIMYIFGFLGFLV